MLYLISYDISENKRRTKLAKLLEGFGQRVLESVFECDLEPQAYRTLRRRIDRRLRPAEGDRLRVYRLCSSCVAQVEVIGDGPPVERSVDVYIV
ncbi:CRISPR-associated endonuclease Cas2 [Oscillochloris sp. ZM17-4]|uniref:CRISPR-associated endonuclease Cas2 n=1 Tax=Oscillochloris sp. ZM17-4 TaxID=2866714 RepID=UPI001C730D44|nr:CRISPR-associated endonuclease Cas2 [Oscillochloris sp. ZM17-4]MBX0327150.1 CRISPR-associated endonuclease Cas2 [Oscillochloris sp. ZM17-4]